MYMQINGPHPGHERDFAYTELRRSHAHAEYAGVQNNNSRYKCWKF